MADTFLMIILVLAVVVLLTWLLIRPRKKSVVKTALPDNFRQILIGNVRFYQRLSDEQKPIFESRVQHFLSSVTVSGVGVVVEDLDKVLIGASAVIPVFQFPDWEYINVREVLLYPESFNEQFETTGADRSVLGMVGDGPMQQVMILSQYALREGFSNKTDKQNTAIHEFVHLVDKTDGATDGVPEVLLGHQYVLPWIDMMYENIKSIQADKSDINPYASKNKAEFLAVVAEYFFERPDLLKTKHPQLFDMMGKMFGRKD